mgnify:CR=1 FL=1|nr:MAG TPA: YopX protein [Caudoviricetes sp.]
MNDRYLFKAKKTDSEEWVIGNLITNVFFRLGQSIPYILCPDKAEYDCFEDFTEENGIFEVRPDTICQCTGLKDKNGKLIWENDIVVCRDFTEEKYVIAWKQDEACFEYQQYGCSIMNFEQLSGCEVEVIGNIFDNAGLLESEG